MSGIYTLIDKYSSGLKESTEKFNFDDPQVPPEQIASMLAETMIKHKGVGLAAPQVGLPLSVFVIGDPANRDSIMAFFNPNIVDFSKEKVYYNEGCLTFPGLYIKIKRPTQIRMRFTDVHGETTTTKYTGFSSRAIQHEYDHLQGISFQKKATLYHLSKAKKDQKKSLRRAR